VKHREQYGSAMIGNNTSALLSAGESRHRRAYKFKQVSEPSLARLLPV